MDNYILMKSKFHSIELSPFSKLFRIKKDINSGEIFLDINPEYFYQYKVKDLQPEKDAGTDIIVNRAKKYIYKHCVRI